MLAHNIRPSPPNLGFPAMQKISRASMLRRILLKLGSKPSFSPTRTWKLHFIHCHPSVAEKKLTIATFVQRYSYSVQLFGKAAPTMYWGDIGSHPPFRRAGTSGWEEISDND
jgi:hypothetical protein